MFQANPTHYPACDRGTRVRTNPKVDSRQSPINRPLNFNFQFHVEFALTRTVRPLEPEIHTDYCGTVEIVAAAAAARGLTANEPDGTNGWMS